MVLKKFRKGIMLFLLLQITFLCFSQEENYWNSLIQTAFHNSANTSSIKKDYISTLISKKQYDYQWFPNFQIGFQTSFNASRGDTLYILNQASDSEITWIASPSTGISIYQKLPGNGYVSLGMSYGFNYSLERKVFLQWPQLQLSLNQKLSRGAFGITKNPEHLLIAEQMSYYSDLYKRNLDSEVQNILGLIQQADILCAQENYYQALAKEYESEMLTSKEKNRSGMQSSLETHYASRQYSEALNYLNDITYEKALLNQELLILIPDFIQDDLQEERFALQKIIQKIYDEIKKEPEDINKNFNNGLYSSIQRQYLYQYQNNEINYAPELYMTTSISPDSSFNSYYSDWFKSFRVLKETPYPIDFSFTMGIRKTFELPQAKKLRQETFQLSKDALEKNFLIARPDRKTGDPADGL